MTGSGKTTTRQHLIKEFLFLSSHTRKEEKIQKQILGVNTIMEAFGIAASNHNEAASCLDQFQTLQFNERGRITGCSISIFLLDKSRVSRHHTQQYNIFYQLLAGTTPDEKQALHITHNNFSYLKQHHQRNSEKDLVHFTDFKAALKICGFKTKTVAQMCQLLAAILHLGNVQFVDGNKHHFTDGSFSAFTGSGGATTSSGSQESCRIKNKETLSLVAAALGVSTAKLESALTHKLKLIGNEFCTAFLTTDTASQQRDSLAHTLYTVLVLWIVNALNQKLKTEQGLRTISILDTAGFHLATAQRAGSFHDLCVNYTSEQLLAYTLDRTFNPESTDNLAPFQDGIRSQFHSSLSMVSSPSSSLSLYHGTNRNSFALIPLMNAESKRFQSYALDATDSNLLSVLFQKKKASQNKHVTNDYLALLNPSTLSHSFAIRHYDTVTIDYSVDGFLESNVDAISPDFVHLFQHNCTNAFVNELFQANSLAGWVTDVHPRDERTVIKAQLPVWPSSLKKPTDAAQKPEPTKTPEDSKSSAHESDERPLRKKRSLARQPPTSNIRFVWDQIVQGVDELKAVLNAMRLTEIIHIRPNDAQQPDVFDISYVQHQLKTLRLTELAIQASQYDTFYSYTQKAFLSRYRPLIEAYLPVDETAVVEDEDRDEAILSEDNTVGENKEEIEKRKHCILHWIEMMHWSSQQIRFGQNDIWLSFSLWRSLENQMRTMEKEARLREKERLAVIEAEKEAQRQAAIAAALEAEEYEAAQRAQAEAEAAAQAAEIAAIAADRWSSDKNPFDDDCRSDMTNEDDRTEIEAQFDQSGKRSDWEDDDDPRGLADG
jgi:chitin synthase